MLKPVLAFKVCWLVSYVLTSHWQVKMEKRLITNAKTRRRFTACAKGCVFYMPKAIEVNEYDFAGRVDKILQDINTVREILLINDIDPDEVYGDLNPDDSPNSSY